MKVLHLISSGGMYGAETMLLNLTRAQNALGAEAVIGVFANQQSPHTEVAEEGRKRGLQVQIFNCGGRFDYGTIRAIRDFSKSHNVSVIHGHGYKGDIYGSLGAWLSRLPFIATCHLWTGATTSIRLYEFLDSLAMRRATKVVGVSDAITEDLAQVGISPGKLSTIYNGTELSNYKGARPTLREELGIGDRLLVGTVCRLEEQKGLDYLVRASQGVLKEFPEALIVIVGEGSLRSHLTELIQELGLESNVRLLGARRDMPGVYASLDLFVLPSIDEGMPMVVLEALAAGRPVVATRVGAVGKLIIPGETGFLVESKNVPALEEAMLQSLRNRETAQELARRGEALVQQNYSATRMAKQYLALYEDAVELSTQKVGPNRNV